MNLGSLITLASLLTLLLASLFSILWTTPSIGVPAPLSLFPLFLIGSWIVVPASLRTNHPLSKSPKVSLSKKPGTSLLSKNLSSPPRPTTPATLASPTNRKLGRTGAKIGETALVVKTGRDSRLMSSGNRIFASFRFEMCLIFFLFLSEIWYIFS